MIVPMEHLTLLCVASEGEKALESLRELGCVHLDLSAAASPEFAEAKGELADAERAVRILDKAARDVKACPVSTPEGVGIFDSVRNADLTGAVLKADAERTALAEEADALRQTIRTYAPFGGIDSSRIIATHEVGLSDDVTIQYRVAAYQVANGEASIDKAIAGFGTYKL